MGICRFRVRSQHKIPSYSDAWSPARALQTASYSVMTSKLFLKLRCVRRAGFWGCLLLAAFLLGCGGGSSSTTAMGNGVPISASMPAMDHVFLVVLENHGFSDW